MEKQAKGGKAQSARRAPVGDRPGMELLSHLCDVMGLFPAVGEAAIGELAGKMMAERLRREAAGGARRPGRAKARQRNRR
jgi:hypothetical protein